MATVVGQREVNIGAMPLDQLNNLKQQLEEELQSLNQSYGGMKEAQLRFMESKSVLSNICPENEGREIMVPLTNSLYVPGRLTNVDEVMVDIGTGYYVGHTVAKAQDFMERKSSMLDKNLEGLTEIISQKRQNAESVTMVMQHKIKAADQAQRAGAGASSEVASS